MYRIQTAWAAFESAVTSVRTKEAVKIALSLVLVYSISLQSGWMNPYWAGLAVAMVSLAPPGQSIRKGFLRICGTFPGCLAALLILALAPQNPCPFIMLVGGWIFFTTYMMLHDKERSYLWNVAGFVCLIIVLTGPSSSANTFEHAMYRTVETILGVLVYTGISIFLWPVSSRGGARKSGLELLETQQKLLGVDAGSLTQANVQEDLGKLQVQGTTQLQQLRTMIQAESSENYEMQRMRPRWREFAETSERLLAAQVRCWFDLSQLNNLDVDAVFPDLQVFVRTLSERIERCHGALSGGAVIVDLPAVRITSNAELVRKLTVLDRAAVAVLQKDLRCLDSLTRSMSDRVNQLTTQAHAFADSSKPPVSEPGAGGGRAFTLPAPDLDYLRGAGFAVATVIVGFTIWIYVNPPGHASWFQLTGTIAMAVAATQQMKAKNLVVPVGLASMLGVCVYVFVMPRLTSFYELGAVLFVCVFVNSYYFTGVARLAGFIAIINEISVHNQQTYDFAAMANSFLFTMLAFYFVFVMSYLLSSARPEKALLRLLSRYFRSVDYLSTELAVARGDEAGLTALYRRWKTNFYLRELKTLPGKIGPWSDAIDLKSFPDNSREQIHSLVASLQILSYRVESLLSAGRATQSRILIDASRSEISAWLASIARVSREWSSRPEAGNVESLQQHLAEGLNTLEARFRNAGSQLDKSAVDESDAENYFHLLSSLRGVSEASLTYAKAAEVIDFPHWREERFS